MGYILPIRPIQSEQYANRLNMDRYKFAAIERLARVKLKSEFLEEFEEQVFVRDQKEEDAQEERQGQSENKPESSPRLYQGYIAPNPANLSPAISHVVGKGIEVNYYA